MKLEHKDLPMIFSETTIPDIFFTEYLPEMSGDCLKLYLYMNFLSKHNKTVKVNDLTKKLSLSFGCRRGSGVQTKAVTSGGARSVSGDKWRSRKCERRQVAELEM